mgnify:CR=1 FL=1|tara:strand:+ start:2710 stop:4242 length:1533 start_codon:yes stop_codon:yes gene_type:complete
MDFLLLFGNDFQVLIPELFITLSICILLMYGVLNSTSFSANFPILSRNVSWLCILTIGWSIYLMVNEGIFDFSGTSLYGLLKIDSWTQATKLIVLTSALLSLLISLDYLKKEKLNDFEFSILILLALLGMLFIISSHDLMSFYMAIELQSLSLYVLACFKRTSVLSVEAGLKYFILGAFSSGLLLFGISMIYGFSGATHFEDIAKLVSVTSMDDSFISSGGGIKVGLLFVCIGLLFKIYAVPFHQWVPDVYQGSPTIVTAFFATTPSLSVFALLVRVLHSTFYNLIIDWQIILIICSVLSLIVGSLGALYQIKIKRFLAYSAISHVGYILIALSTGSMEGVESLLFYIIVYILMSISFFSIIMSMRTIRRSSETYEVSYSEGEIENMDDFKGLGRIRPIYSFILAILLFSMAGIPPLAGFFSKLYIFISAIKEDLIYLVLIGILASVLGAVYYLKIIRWMYFSVPENWFSFDEISKERSYLISLAMCFVSFFFLYPNPILLTIHKLSIII